MEYEYKGWVLEFGFVGGPYLFPPGEKGFSVAREWAENVREHNECCDINLDITECPEHNAKAFLKKLYEDFSEV